MAYSRRLVLGSGLAALIPLPVRAAAETGKSDTLIVPIRLTSDRLWVIVKLPDGRQEIAVFDSGAAWNKISQRTAYDLKLPQDWQTQIEGLGGTERTTFVRLDDSLLGGVYKPGPMWFLTSETLDSLGFKFLIGAATLTYAISEFDFVANQWRVHKQLDPAALGYTQVQDGMRLRDKLHSIEMPCEFAGLEGRFHFDTGSPTNFILDGQASKRLNLWDSQQPFAPWRLRGFGPNRTMTRLYRTKWAKVHGLILNNPLVLLSDPKLFRSQFMGLDGLIGLRAIRHFDVAMHGKDKTLWLKPNSHPNQDDPRYPMSGLWLEQKRGAIVVDEVGIGSPAAGAGVQVGDQVIGADWQTLLKTINGDAGTPVALELERAGKRLAAQFTLQPFL